MARVEIQNLSVTVGDGDETVGFLQRHLVVTLSEENLIRLLAKLHSPGTQAGLVVGDRPGYLASAVIMAEPDDLHYSSPTRQGASAPGMRVPNVGTLPEAIKAVLDLHDRALRQ